MAGKRIESTGVGRFAYEGLDRALHEKARLGILTSLLARPEGLVFNEVKRVCSLTDGNLSRHLQVLRDEGLVVLWKGKGDGRPQTLCRLTPNGRKRFLAYLGELERVVRDARLRQGYGGLSAVARLRRAKADAAGAERVAPSTA